MNLLYRLPCSFWAKFNAVQAFIDLLMVATAREAWVFWSFAAHGVLALTGAVVGFWAVAHGADDDDDDDDEGGGLMIPEGGAP